MKIFDCTTFYNENLMLEVRFNILNDFVDKFVISEAKYSHSGEKKKLNFDINKFKQFKKKIIYLVIDNEPDSLIYKKKTIHGYGASTKGNVLLQYFGLNQKYIKYIADRNPKKFNHYTPGTKIKIISEKKSRKLSPDYYLVLPWHFKNEILQRETKIRKKGCKFIFPLPNLKIY